MFILRSLCRFVNGVFCEKAGMGGKFREGSGNERPLCRQIANGEMDSWKYAALVSHFLQKAWCQEKCLPRGAVHAHGPFRGTAPRGGHSVLPRGESGLRRMEAKKAQSLSDLGLAEGASHECAETRAFRAGGARSRGQFRRAIAPGRGLFRPRNALNNCPCARATLCCFETANAVGSILGERITPTSGQ